MLGEASCSFGVVKDGISFYESGIIPFRWKVEYRI